MPSIRKKCLWAILAVWNKLERGMDMNPKQYFFSLKESHHVRVSVSLPTAWSRFQSHNYLSRQQSARIICQLARGELAGHPRERHLLLFCTNWGARCSLMLCARNQCLLPTWFLASLHTPGSGCWLPSIMRIITRVSNFLGR